MSAIFRIPIFDFLSVHDTSTFLRINHISAASVVLSMPLAKSCQNVVLRRFHNYSLTGFVRIRINCLNSFRSTLVTRLC